MLKITLKKFFYLQSSILRNIYDIALHCRNHTFPPFGPDELKRLIEDKSAIAKLNKLYVYIENNKDGIVNYEFRKTLGLVFTSNLAESTVNTIINERQKGKQKMLWGRDGAHNVLQIRASLNSKSWDRDWPKVENIIYKAAA